MVPARRRGGLRGAGGGYRVAVHVGGELGAVVGVVLGARRRRELLLLLQLGGAPLRDVRPHDAAPVQEGVVEVLRRKVAVVRVAGGGRLAGGPGEAAEEAPQAVAELRGRPGRAPRARPVAAPALPQGRRRRRQEGDREGRPLDARRLASAAAAGRAGEAGGGGS